MRPLLIILSLCSLAGCATDPAKLGITGPGQAAPVRRANATDQGSEMMPGVATMGTFYGPTNGGPQTGASGFWGYNN
ncbi:MAG: hypothetical protein U1E70_21285 [Acetobacteraceae bacterium]|nr:hypothetical protein [Pseudomonadota bacterium]